MSQNKLFRRAAGALLVCASVVSVSALGTESSGVVSAESADQGGEFHSLTPVRILDTRPDSSINDVAPIGAKALTAQPWLDKSGEFHFNPLGKGGLPANQSDVLAVVANIAVTEPGSGGWLSVYPRGYDLGGPNGANVDKITSLINFQTGDSIPNMVIVGLGTNGEITFNAKGVPGTTFHVVVDVLGWISTSQYTGAEGASAGARLELVTPGRLMDTRESGGPVGTGGNRALKVRGANTIPDPLAPVVNAIVPDRPTVTAALVNLTLVNDRPDSGGTFVSATPVQLPLGDSHPSSSNAVKGNIKATTTIVPIAPDGSINFYNHNGNVDLVVDVLGYFETGINVGNNKGRVVPLEAPFRAFDTREPAFGNTRLQSGSKEEWSFDLFTQSVTLNPDSSAPQIGPAQLGLIGNLAAIELMPPDSRYTAPRQSSYLRITPAGVQPALTANVNFFLNEVVPNMSVVKYGTSGADTKVVDVYNHYGQIHYALDVFAIVLDA